MNNNELKGVRYIKRNLATNAIGIIAPSLAWVLIVPILLKNLGQVDYGIFVIACSVAGILGFLEFGLNTAAIKFISEADYSSRVAELNKIIVSNCALYIVTGFIIIASCSTFSKPISNMLFKNNAIEIYEADLIIKIIGVVIALTLLKNAFSSVIMGLHRYDIYNIIQTGYAIMLCITHACIAVLGGKVIHLLIGSVFVVIISIVALFIAIQRLIPGVNFFTIPDYVVFKKLFSFGIYIMVLNALAAILFNVDKVLVGLVLGPEKVAFYAVPNQIAIKIHTGLAILVSFIFPLSSELSSMGAKNKLQSYYLKSTRFILLLYCTVMLFMGIFARPILGIWIDADFAEYSYTLLFITTLSFTLFSLSITPYHYLLGMGKQRGLALINLILTCSIITCMYAGLKFNGLLGGCIGYAIGMISVLLFPLYVQRLLKINLYTALKSSFTIGIFMTILGLMTSLLLPSQLFVKIIYFIIVVTGLILVLYRTIFDDFKPKNLASIKYYF